MIGNEMRTALDHFVSEGRQLHRGADCASFSPLSSRLSQNNKKCHRASKSNISQCELAAIQTFEWSFQDLQIKDLEVFEGDHTDGSAAVDIRFSNEGLDRGAGMEQYLPRCSSSSDSTVNRPVRVIVGKKISNE